MLGLDAMTPPPRHGRACPDHPRLFLAVTFKAWMLGTRPSMTERKTDAAIQLL
jgi:hypothetical protein